MQPKDTDAWLQKNPPALPEIDKAGRQDFMFFVFCLKADKNIIIF
jgi:hypothetical protein